MLICRNAKEVHVLVHMFRESLRNPALDQMRLTALLKLKDLPKKTWCKKLGNMEEIPGYIVGKDKEMNEYCLKDRLYTYKRDPNVYKRDPKTNPWGTQHFV